MQAQVDGEGGGKKEAIKGSVRTDRSKQKRGDDSRDEGGGGGGGMW